MAIETERKFLVTGTEWLNKATGKTCYRQGYICREKERTVRVRVGETAYLTIKGPSRGISRDEFEYEIPLDDAEAMLATICHKPLIEKVRYNVPHASLTWEVDVFEGENQGLVLAEIELDNENIEVPLPDWVGVEVTGDSRYNNASLVGNPFSQWGNNARSE